MIETCDEILRVLKLCQEKNKSWDVNKRGLHITLLQNSFCLNAQIIAHKYNTLLEIPNQSSVNGETTAVVIDEIDIDTMDTAMDTSIDNDIENIEHNSISNETDQDKYDIFDLISTEKLYPYTVECQLEDTQGDFPILLSRLKKINKSFSESTLKSSLYGSDSIMPYEMNDALLNNIWN